MASARRRRRQRYPEAILVREGVAHYVHDYHYKLYHDEHGYHVVFDGRFAPFATVDDQRDAQRVAQEILKSFLDTRIAEITARAEAIIGKR